VKVTLPVIIDKESGTIRVPVDIDTTELGGKKLVAYEELWNVADKEEPVLVAEHKDIEDEGQTIQVTLIEESEVPQETPEEPKAPQSAPKTGDVANALIWLVCGGIALAVAMYIGVSKKKNAILGMEDTSEIEETKE